MTDQPHERAVMLLTHFFAGLMQGPNYPAQTSADLSAYFRALLPSESPQAQQCDGSKVA